MTETVRDGNGIHVVGEEQGGMAMAQIMEADALEAVLIGELAELLGGRVVVLRCTIPAADDAALSAPAIAQLGGNVVLIGFCLLEQGHHACGQVDGAAAFLGFWVGGVIAKLRHIVQASADVDGAALPVYIIPAQCADLAKPKSARQRKHHCCAEGQ